MMAFMEPTLPSAGSFSIKLADNDYHDEIRAEGGRGEEKPALSQRWLVPQTNFGESKKIKGALSNLVPFGAPIVSQGHDDV
jgi:hypothetical protein